MVRTRPVEVPSPATTVRMLKMAMATTTRPESACSMGRGVRTRAMASRQTNRPEAAMIMPWMSAASPSDLPWPKRCSESAGDMENRTAQNVRPDASESSTESASDDSMDVWWQRRFTLDEFHERLQSVPQCRRTTLPDCGHMLHHDQPDLLAREVEAFLAPL